MKKIVILATFAFASLVGFSQEMSKEEVKEWKTKLKTLTPEAYKELSDQNKEYYDQLKEKEQTVTGLQSENASLQAQLDKCNTSLEAKEGIEVADKPAEVVEQIKSENNYTKTYEAPAANTKGLLYKVQIGAFKNFDLREYFNNTENFSGEIDADGTMRYTLGVFKEYWEADKFKQFLRKMGVKGAWVVAFKDGVRVELKDALEGAL